MPRASSPGKAGGRRFGSLPYAVVLAAAALLYFFAGRFQFAVKPGELGPDVWPKAILGLLIAVCAFEVARRARAGEVARRDAMPDSAAEAAGQESGDAPPRRLPHLLAAGVVLAIAYVAALGGLGFFLATALFLALFMLVGRYRRLPVVAATSVLGSLAFVFVFMKVVYVSLPLGVGPFQTVSLWILGLLGVR